MLDARMEYTTTTVNSAAHDANLSGKNPGAGGPAGWTKPVGLHRDNTPFWGSFLMILGAIQDVMGPSRSLESFLSRETAAPSVDLSGATREAHTAAPLDTLQDARSWFEPSMWRGEA
jgi:hypothetical protein